MIVEMGIGIHDIDTAERTYQQAASIWRDGQRCHRLMLQALGRTVVVPAAPVDTIESVVGAKPYLSIPLQNSADN